MLTGIGGDAWIKAAEVVAERLGVEIEPYVIGPGRELEDLYGDWARAREITDTGCLVVRPDAHVAYRANTVDADPTTALTEAFEALLGRG